MSWLIDGQQRVTTLSRVLSGDEGIEVVFNYDTEHFRLANAASRNDPAWVRVADLFDDHVYREMWQEIPQTRRGTERVARFEKVRSIRNYEIPVVEMIDHTFEDAVLAFTRINSLGVRLRTQDIENAKVSARHSGLIADEVIPFTDKPRRGSGGAPTITWASASPQTGLGQQPSGRITLPTSNGR